LDQLPEILYLQLIKSTLNMLMAHLRCQRTMDKADQALQFFDTAWDGYRRRENPVHAGTLGVGRTHSGVG